MRIEKQQKTEMCLSKALDHQVQIALRDDQQGEKFAEHIAELAAQIANATFTFSQNVKSAYASLPKRRLSDRDLDEIDQARLTLGAFSFFIHILDRHLVRIDSRALKKTVLDFIFENVVRVYARSFPGSSAETEKFVLNHYDRRAPQLAAAPTIFGEGSEDRHTVMWRASQAICEEDLGRDDFRLVVLVQTNLMQELESLAIADRVAAMAEVLSLPRDLRKIA
jgi:hypothetical protein